MKLKGLLRAIVNRPFSDGAMQTMVCISESMAMFLPYTRWHHQAGSPISALNNILSLLNSAYNLTSHFIYVRVSNSLRSFLTVILYVFIIYNSTNKYVYKYSNVSSLIKLHISNFNKSLVIALKRKPGMDVCDFSLKYSEFDFKISPSVHTN
jgi:hypothetical protein